LKAVREKNKITYKSKSIKITEVFSMETLKAKRAGVRYFRHLKKIVSALGYSTQQNYHSKWTEK
jgi:hypothetical protein